MTDLVEKIPRSEVQGRLDALDSDDHKQQWLRQGFVALNLSEYLLKNPLDFGRLLNHSNTPNCGGNETRGPC